MQATTGFVHAKFSINTINHNNYIMKQIKNSNILHMGANIVRNTTCTLASNIPNLCRVDESEKRFPAITNKVAQFMPANTLGCRSNPF